MIGGLLAGASVGAAELARLAGRELLYSAVLFVIVLALTGGLRRTSPALRNALWGLVLLRLVLPVGLASPVSLGSVVARSLPAALLVEAWPGGDGGWEMVGPVVAADRARAAEAAPPLWPLALAVVWLAGAGLTGGSFYRRRREYRRIVREATAVGAGRVEALVRRWRAALGIRRPVVAVTSAALHSPFTIGSLRPVVFVPRAVVEHDDPGGVESVIAHELAHVKRWDDLALVAQLFITALYFFDPVAWWSGARMREESERACDRLAIGQGRLSPRGYARGIVTVLRLGMADGPGLTPALGRGMKRVQARLEAIMKAEADSLYKKGARLTLPAGLALAAFLLPMSGAAVRRAALEPAATATQDADASPLSNPLPGARVSARFGPMRDPFTGEPADHLGIDLVGAPGAQVLAPADGVVEVATEEYEGGAAYGTVVIIDHGGALTTRFYHLGSLSVSPGESVSRGEVLGTQGATGRVTGPHVHFEVRVNGEAKDPALYVSDWEVGSGGTYRM